MDNKLKGLQSSTGNSGYLQGLYALLVGTSLMTWGILELTGAANGRRIGVSLFLWTNIFGLPIVLRYYWERFGAAMPPASRNHRWLASVFAGAALLSVMVLYDTGHLRGLPFEPFGLVCGLVLLFPPRRHYIVLGVLVIGFSLLPAFHLVTREQVWHGGAMLLVGLVLILGGLIDDEVLFWSLPPEEPDERHA